MLLKERKESDELKINRSLNARMGLTEKEKYHYFNLEKGYEGEVKFDQLIKDLPEERYVIADLLLEVNNSHFQIDTVIISQEVIHLDDVKYFQGDFYLDSDKLYSASTRRELKNPLDQLKRSETLFNQLLQKLKLNFLLKPALIFNNPEFTLYQAPMDSRIILPTQINRFLNDLTKTPSKLNDRHSELAQKLLSLHKTKNPFTVIPEYDFHHLKRGINCVVCHSFEMSIEGRKCLCKNCGHTELVTATVVRSVEEFKLLFPERKITSQSISDWTKVNLSKKALYRILKKNYTAFGNRSGTFYQ